MEIDLSVGLKMPERNGQKRWPAARKLIRRGGDYSVKIGLKREGGLSLSKEELSDLQVLFVNKEGQHGARHVASSHNLDQHGGLFIAGDVHPAGR